MVPTESTPRRSRTVIIVAAVAAAAVVAGYFLLRGPSSGQAPRFETATLDRGEIISRVTATGTISAMVTVLVGAQVTGRIAELLVDFNAPVKKGQLIARIDAATFEAALAEARANLGAATANLERSVARAEEAHKQEQRLKELVDRELVSRSEYDAARSAAVSTKAEVAASKSSIEQAKAAVERAQTNLSYTRILAPIDGVVLSRAIDVGQTVAASLQAPTLFTIAGDLRKMQVEAAVAEADIGRVEEGKEANFTVDAYPGERFEGTVRQVRNYPTTQQGVVTYVAVIDVENTELRLKPGMTANVTFVVEERDDVLRVPQAALRFRAPRATPGTAANGAAANGAAANGAAANGAASATNDGPASGPSAGRGKKLEGRVLSVLRGGELVQVRVKTGLTDGSLTEVVEVLDGQLAAGDTVVTGSLENAKPSSASSSLIPSPRPRR